MRIFGRELSGYSQVLVTLVAIFLVSSGLCGITAAFSPGLGDTAITLGLIELFAMVVSLLGILIMLLLLPFRLWNRALERKRLAELEGASDSRADDGPERR